MKSTIEFLKEIVKERPVGTKANQEIHDIIREEALQRGCDFILLPFDCKVWERGASSITAGSSSYEIYPSPFSKPCEGNGPVTAARSMEELAAAELKDRIVFLLDDISKEAMMPKDFPFYYPDEHKQLIDLLEAKKPKAIIAVTGKHPMCGLEPFPMFEDGNFAIPSAYINKATAENILEQVEAVELNIASGVSASKSSQPVVTKRSKRGSRGTIILCAHMDTKYGTAGAIDNAAGVAVLLAVMERLKDYDGAYDIEFVPFNGEEYYEAKGELVYSEYLQNSYAPVRLAINIDGPCHRSSQTAVSSYNFDEETGRILAREMAKHENIVPGVEWYAGDHSMFAYGGIPCIAVTSSNLYGEVLDLTHTEKDTIDQLSFSLIEETAGFLAGLVKAVAAK